MVESCRFVREDDPTLERYAFNPATGFVCKTPEQFNGLRLLGASKGSYRIQFTLPAKDDEPKTVELQRSTLSNPSFGAVKLVVPINGVGIQVGFDPLKKRIFAVKVRDGSSAQKARIQKGDFIRAVSVPEGVRTRGGLFSRNTTDVEDAMIMLDGKLPTSYYAALKENFEANPELSEVVLLIERPTKLGDDNWWTEYLLEQIYGK